MMKLMYRPTRINALTRTLISYLEENDFQSFQSLLLSLADRSTIAFSFEELIKYPSILRSDDMRYIKLLFQIVANFGNIQLLINWDAVRHIDNASVKRMFIEYGENIFGISILEDEISFEFIQFLLEAGKHPDNKSLEFHCRRSCKEQALILIDAGADIYHSDAFFVCCEGEDLSLLQIFLDRGCDLSWCDQTNERNTTLMRSCFGFRADDCCTIVRYILQSGQVDVNGRSTTGKTALMYAVARKSSHVVKLLFDHGADPNLQGYEDGVTALMLACKVFFVNKEIIKLLVDYGARLDIETKNRETAVDIAANRGERELIEYLESFTFQIKSI